MDFVSLATASHQFLRQLTTTTGGNDSNNDDFTSIAGGGTFSDASSTTRLPQQSSVAGEDSSHAPILSKAAEAELYMLASNFLLYVAMVIIATMVAKIYFPESLERGRGDGEPTLQARSYSYRRAPEDANVLDDDDDEYHDEDDDDDEDDELELLGSDGGNDADGGPLGKHPKRPKDPLIRRHSSFLEDAEHQNFTKIQVLRRLAMCCIMLNITFVSWGVLQERMLTRRYPRGTGEYFTYSYFLVFTNRFWTLILSGILLLYLKPSFSRSTVLYEYSFPSISNMLSSWCQYEALRYVSFPATTLFKAFKLAPVMLMGKLLGNKTYPQYDYVVAFLIGVGIAMFMSSTDDLKFGYDYLGDKASATWTGVMLLFLFLLFDSFTSQFQSRMFQRHRDLSMVELMFATSAFSTILSGITLIHTKELYPALEFVYRHSEIHAHFLLFSVCSTIGQLFIFYTIKNFGAVVFTLIMTTRILLSIALSCFLYGHRITEVAFLGIMVVMGAVLYRIRKQAQGKQILKWRGMEDDKAEDLVQEWHEQLDM